jgi:tetratricopeptide (TPR) repeat protein
MMLRRLSVTITAAIIWQLCSSLTLAETKKPPQPDKFPPSPLEITIPDPLLPRKPTNKQPLSIQEQQDLAVALDNLNQEAAAKMQAGDKVGAFDIWNRELRLRRYLGSLTEAQALSRVGAIAWNENNRPEIFYIMQRLQKIQTSSLQKQKKLDKTISSTTADVELWRSLAMAYTNLRSPSEAVQAYDQVLAAVRQNNDVAAEVETLKTMGELHMSWFDYTKAGDTYQQLLNLAAKSGDRINQLAYLQQLAYIYEQQKQPQQSIKVRNQLIEAYQSENNLIQIPELKLAIGSDYQSLGKENPTLLPEAFKNYQEAYTTAWQQQQYVTAGEALQKLIALYRSQGQTEEALQTGQILVQTQEKAVNFYGMMKAYDQIGQIYLERKEPTLALAAFQKGLELAQQLKHDEAYFTEQIQKLSK